MVSIPTFDPTLITNVLGQTILGPNLHGMPITVGGQLFIVPKAIIGALTDEEIPNRTPSGSMGNKMFRFNPPLHPLNLPRRVDFASDRPDQTMDYSYLDERKFTEPYKNPDNLKQLRLGRIIQHENAAGMAAVNAERYGFRFLYNPTTVSLSSSRNDSVILDARSAVNAVISGIGQNFQTITMKLLLNRLPDVLMQDEFIQRSDYLPGIRQEDFEGMRKYGTHWDLEILYRVCNGIFNLEDRGRTGDIGTLLPSNARLILGPEQDHFGFVQAISWNDLMFSKNMVPVRTEVEIMFRRHVDMAPGALFQVEGTFGLAQETERGTIQLASSDDSGLSLSAAQAAALYSTMFGAYGVGVSFSHIISSAWKDVLQGIADRVTGGDEGGDDGGGTGEPDGGNAGANVQAMIPAKYWNAASRQQGQKTVSQALARARAKVGKYERQGKCIQFVTIDCFGIPGGHIGIDYAYQTWGNCPAQYRHPGDRKPPPGAVVLWNSQMGGGAGHAAISVGGGRMISTTNGAIKEMPLYKDHYYGWIPPIFQGTAFHPLR